MQPSARSLTLDLLSTLRRGSMPVRALIAAGELFDLAENNVRVSLARLRAAGLVERDERGRYRLGADAIAVDSHVTSWHRAPARMRAWGGSGAEDDRGDRSWVAVHRSTGPKASARGSSRGEKRGRLALWLLGFRALEPGLDLRPDNLAGGVDALREELGLLGLGEDASVFGIRELDAEREQRARALWNGPALEQAYAAARDRLEESEVRLPTLARAEAMIESFRIGGAAIRQIAVDPLLPAPIVAEGALDALVAALRRYDLAGRTCWAEFLAEHGVALRRARSAPADRRGGELNAVLAAADFTSTRLGGSPA